MLYGQSNRYLIYQYQKMILEKLLNLKHYIDKKLELKIFIQVLDYNELGLSGVDPSSAYCN